jgi:hypothetical protein
MADDVNLPVLGKTKITWVVAGIAVLGGILGYAWWKHAQTAAAANASSISAPSAAASSAATSGIDPETGYPYGSTQDEEALQSLYGAGSYGGGTYYEPYSTGTTSSASGTTITTNNAWLQNIIDTNDTGYSTNQIIQAVSAWFSGTQISTSELSVIQTCEALYGAPPQSLPAPNVSTTGNTGTQSGSDTVPNVIGQSVSQAESALASAGFTYSLSGPSTGTIWSQTPSAGYTSNGGSVDIASSATGKPPEVPNVMGMTVQAAESALTAAGYKYSLSGTSAGKIWSQTPAGGFIAASGGTVDIAASASGKPPAGA